MSTLHVRGVPEDVYEALRALALERRTSIGAEAVRQIQRGLRGDRAGVAELLANIEATRPRARRGAKPAAALIRADRDAR